MTSREADFGMKPVAPRSSARATLSRSLSAERTTTEIAGWRPRSSASTSKPLRSGRFKSRSTRPRSGFSSARRRACRESDEIGVLVRETQGVPRVGRIDDGCVVLQFLQHAAQRVPNQGMIVDDENLHALEATMRGLNRPAALLATLLPMLAVGCTAAFAAHAQAPDPGDLAEGLRLYLNKGNCQACHGWAGDGRKMDSQMPDGVG